MRRIYRTYTYTIIDTIINIGTETNPYNRFIRDEYGIPMNESRAAAAALPVSHLQHHYLKVAGDVCPSGDHAKCEARHSALEHKSRARGRLRQASAGVGERNDEALAPRRSKPRKAGFGLGLGL